VFMYATRGQPAGVVLRYSDRGYYLVRLYPAVPDTQAKAVLVLVTPNGEVQLGAARTWPGYTPAAWYRVTATAKGGQFSVAIDSQAVLSSSDDTFAAGKFGLFATADGTARFDNFRVTRP
jgi:hypothetical protein